MDLLEEEILGEQISTHWYYRAKKNAMLRALDGIAARTALDIGSGSGFFARQLLGSTEVQHIDCVDTSYPEDGEEHIPGAGTLRRLRGLDPALPAVDLALMMDVLEHVDDDVSLLRDTVACVRPGGHVFITVPAFSWLWSSHDVFLGHHRRYDLRTTRALAERAGLEIVQSHYIFGPVFPAAALQRLFDRTPATEPKSKLATYPKVVNQALFLAASVERPVQHFNRVAGLSVVLLGRA